MPKTTSMGLCMKNRLKPANPAVLSEFIKYRKEMNTINCLDTTVSYFANYYDKIPKQVNLFGYLQNPTHLRDIRNYRQAGKGEVRKAIKSRLPCITPSGNIQRSQQRRSGTAQRLNLHGYRRQRQSPNHRLGAG